MYSHILFRRDTTFETWADRYKYLLPPSSASLYPADGTVQYSMNCDEVRTGYPLEQDQGFTDKDVYIEVYITVTDKEMAKYVKIGCVSRDTSVMWPIKYQIAHKQKEKK